jgi:GntR family transcriptional regulator, transcriptional repressor for pyruvate dehydrogenase complex
MSANFTKITDSTSLSAKVEESIKEAILSRKYRSGEQLPGEIELTKQFGVSRSVVREAIKSLRSIGFLEIRRGVNSGTYVSDLNKLYLKENFSDLIRLRRLSVNHLTQVRLFLEPEVVRLAITEATENDLALIEQNIQEWDSCEDTKQRVFLGGFFHTLIGRACGNPLYSILMENIMDFSEAFVLTTQPDTRIIGTSHEHTFIFQAIKNKDFDKAEKLTTQHIISSVEVMQELEKKYLELLEMQSS